MEDATPEQVSEEFAQELGEVVGAEVGKATWRGLAGVPRAARRPFVAAAKACRCSASWLFERAPILGFAGIVLAGFGVGALASRR